VDETGHGIEIMCVHGHDQPVDHFSHQAPRARGLLRRHTSPWSLPLRR
jgi:hypothetical protein